MFRWKLCFQLSVLGEYGQTSRPRRLEKSPNSAVLSIFFSPPPWKAVRGLGALKAGTAGMCELGYYLSRRNKGPESAITSVLAAEIDDERESCDQSRLVETLSMSSTHP